MVLVCATGWYLAWMSSLRDIQFFGELLGQWWAVLSPRLLGSCKAVSLPAHSRVPHPTAMHSRIYQTCRSRHALSSQERKPSSQRSAAATLRCRARLAARWLTGRRAVALQAEQQRRVDATAAGRDRPHQGVPPACIDTAWALPPAPVHLAELNHYRGAVRAQPE